MICGLSKSKLICQFIKSNDKFVCLSHLLGIKVVGQNPKPFAFPFRTTLQMVNHL